MDRVRHIAEGQAYARHLGIELLHQAEDAVALRLPYQPFLGSDRVNGGAIASLVDLAGTCACWSHPSVSATARGATVGIDIHYLRLVVAADLVARARVRRRGGTLCVAEVVVHDAGGEEVASATVTYKLERERPAASA